MILSGTRKNAAAAHIRTRSTSPALQLVDPQYVEIFRDLIFILRLVAAFGF